MSEDIKPKKKCPPKWFNPLNVLTGLGIIILMFAVFGTLSDQQNTKLNQELISIAIKQNAQQEGEAKARSLTATEERQHLINLTTDVKRIVEAQGNLTQQNREGLVKAINQTYYETIPQIYKAIQKIEAKQPESNFTAQAEAIKNIEKVLENQKTILQRIDNNTVVSNTTVTAIK